MIGRNWTGLSCIPGQLASLSITLLFIGDDIDVASTLCQGLGQDTVDWYSMLVFQAQMRVVEVLAVRV